MYVSISKREDVGKFSCIFKHIGNLQELFKLVFTPEGITGQAMDSAHVCLFELKLEKNLTITKKKSQISLIVYLKT